MGDDLQSVLTWAIANSDPKVLAQQSKEPQEPIDPKWLDVIMGKSETVLMKEYMAVGFDETKDEKERLLALDELALLVENIDNAGDLHTIGGLIPTITMLNSPSVDLQCAAISILSAGCQNFDKFQQQVLDCNGFLPLLRLMSSQVYKVQYLSLQAVGGMIRGNTQSRKIFEENLGLSAVIQCTLTGDAKIQKKSLSLLTSLLRVSPRSRADTQIHHLFPHFKSLLQHNHVGSPSCDIVLICMILDCLIQLATEHGHTEQISNHLASVLVETRVSWIKARDAIPLVNRSESEEDTLENSKEIEDKIQAIFHPVANTSTEDKQKVLKSCSNSACRRQEAFSGQFQLCARCRSRAYCSQACQKQDWKDRHKQLCSTLFYCDFGSSCV